MEEATRKASEDEFKFDKVHTYLSKGEYPPCVTKSQKLVIRRRAKDCQLVADDGQVHYVGHNINFQFIFKSLRRHSQPG